MQVVVLSGSSSEEEQLNRRGVKVKIPNNIMALLFLPMVFEY